MLARFFVLASVAEERVNLVVLQEGAPIQSRQLDEEGNTNDPRTQLL